MESCTDYRVSIQIKKRVEELAFNFIFSIWTKYTFIAIPGSMVIWFIYMPLVSYAGPRLPWGAFMEYAGIVPRLFGNVNYWLFVILVPFACILRDYLWK